MASHPVAALRLANACHPEMNRGMRLALLRRTADEVPLVRWQRRLATFRRRVRPYAYDRATDGCGASVAMAMLSDVDRSRARSAHCVCGCCAAALRIEDYDDNGNDDGADAFALRAFLWTVGCIYIYTINRYE